MPTHNALSVWDFTLSVARTTEDHHEIIKELEQIAKKWTFQKEDSSIEVPDVFSSNDSESSGEELSDESSDESIESDSNSTCYDSEETDFSDSDMSYDSEDSNDSQGGFIHYQGKISLMKRKRLSELVSLCKANNLYLQKAHWSPSSNNGLGSIFYVTKADTRIAGPWADNMEKEIPIPTQLKHIDKLYPYQQEIIDRSLYCWDNRTINVLYDPDGNRGKSTLVLWCKVHRILNCRLIPCILQSFQDLNQAVMSQEVGSLYFVDMPRALPKSKLQEFLAFIETLKNGYVFDTRYRFQERIFNSPTVWLFTNIQLPLEMLSSDRWKLWTIRDDNELVRWPSLEKGGAILYPVVEEKEEHYSCDDNSECDEWDSDSDNNSDTIEDEVISIKKIETAGEETLPLPVAIETELSGNTIMK